MTGDLIMVFDYYDDYDGWEYHASAMRFEYLHPNYVFSSVAVRR